jgi:hypothetical protein
VEVAAEVLAEAAAEVLVELTSGTELKLKLNCGSGDL